MIDTLKLIWQKYLLTSYFSYFCCPCNLAITSKNATGLGLLSRAFLIAYLVDPVVTKLSQSRFFPRWLAVILMMSFIVTFVFLGALLLTNILVEVTTMQSGLGEAWAGFMNWLNSNAPKWFATLFSQVTQL